MDGLGDAQAGGVASRQNRTVFGVAYGAEKMDDLLPAQDNG